MKRLLLVVLPLLGACILCASPALVVDTHAPEDRVQVLHEAGRVVLEVHSPRGIGTATVTLRQGVWPRTLIARFDFAALESLTVSNGTLTLQSGLAYGEAANTFTWDATDERRIPPGSPGCMSIERRGETIEVTLPQALFEDGVEQITLEWIDFYRE